MIQFERFAFDYVALCDQNKNIISVLLLLVVVKSRGFWENFLCHNFSNIHPPFLLETTSMYLFRREILHKEENHEQNFAYFNTSNIIVVIFKNTFWSFIKVLCYPSLTVFIAVRAAVGSVLFGPEDNNRTALFDYFRN